MKLAELIEEHDFYEKCLVTSFFNEPLRILKHMDERIQTGLILTSALGNFKSLDYVDVYSLHAQMVTPGLVQDLHRRGYYVHVWAADSVRTIQRLLDCKVDNLITAYPVRAKEMVYAYRANPMVLRVARLLYGEERFLEYENAV